ncbi:MAG: amino acid adenylation domain-containing protein, partial [Gemmatimonadetes bacterium]|nr:amino acid adenylation domain-containing protein [Gemmatimonadota bacterium]
VGIEENFFELGGHSLLATRVVSRIRETTGVEVPLRALFETPTVAGLAGRVEAAPDSGRSAATRIVRRAVSGLAPLSFAQQRLWFIHQLDPGSSAYNMPSVLRLRGALDVGALRRALTEVVRRHEAVRTALVDRGGGEAVQVVFPAAPVPFPVVDLAGLPEEPRRAEAMRRAAEEGRRPFDLERGPLLRVLLLRLGAEEWVLCFTMHHIVSDGWSMGVLVREVSALYAACSRGEESPLPELEVQYADFAAWQREYLSGGALETQLAWWRGTLAGAPPLLELPTDHPRRATPGATETGTPFELSAATTRALRELGRREGATLFMTLLAGWQTLLARYSGQDDVVVGTPIANRTRAELEPLIGFFVNTLVMRVDLGGDPGFRKLLGRVRETTLGAFAHQDLPFERLVEELAPERSLVHNPLFQVMFALQNVEVGALTLGDLEMEPLAVADTGAKFDVGVTLFEDGERIRGRIDYRTDLFEAATVERMAEHFRLLLEAAVADPDLRVSELPLVGAAEARRLLAEWNAPREYPEERLVPALVAARAERTPDAPAVCGGGRTLSYAELDARASRLAHALRALGVGPETPVGVYLERGPWLPEVVLGIWKAGGAYLPLDPTYPADRLAYMLRDAAAPVLVSQERLRDALPRGAAVLLLDADAASIDARSPVSPGVEVAPEGLAYVIYTSGSTGRPKGVRVPHRALLHTLLASLDAFDFPPDERVPSLASFAFDIWLFEAVLPLLAGGAVRIVPREEVLETERLVEGLAGCTTLHAVPALMRGIVRALKAEERTLPGVRQAFVGGDAVPPDLLEEMRDVFPAAAVHVLYGPTEGAVICASHAARGGGAWRRWVGRPLGNAGLYVLDRALQPVAVGVPGELCIGGASMARDYLGRPELTAEKFVPDPFAAASGARMYRTGDRVRWSADGELEFLGRTDTQVKIRGFRIEPGEVEAVIAEHPEVRDAVVLVRDAASGEPGEKRLVGYVVPGREEVGGAPKAELQAEHVREWESLFDDTYAGEAADEDPAFNVVGWNSSYTGEPIPADEMHEWVEDAAGRLRALRPRRVLEIGCGTGLLLFRLAPECDEYWGADFSPAALAYLRGELARPGRELPGVRLLERTADDFTGIPEGYFDLVVINSVVQYFPGVEYLLRVLDGAVAALAPGGTLWVGDVRSLPLLEAFHASVELAHEDEAATVSALRDRVRRRAMREKELLVDPELFRVLPRRLPRISGVETRLKGGRRANEMTRFRYDVLLRVESEAPPVAPVCRSGDELGSVEAVGRVLDGEAPGALVVARVPNPRVAGALAVLEALTGDAEPES